MKLKSYFLSICYLPLFFLFFSEARTQSFNTTQLGFEQGNGPWYVDAVQNYAYLSSGEVVSTSNAAAPMTISSTSFSGLGTAVHVLDDHVFYGTGMVVNFHIYNITNPQIPVWVSTLAFPNSQNGIFGIDIRDSIAYLAAGMDGIVTVDISDYQNPVPLDTLRDTIPAPATWQCRDVTVRGNKLYAATYSGMWVVDITDPSNMVVLAKYGGFYYSIDQDDDIPVRIFVGKDQGGGIEVIDVSNPSQPAPVGNVVNAGGIGDDLKYSACKVFESCSQGVYIYDVSQNQPVLIGRYDAPGAQSISVDVYQGLIYHYRGGLHIVQLDTTIICHPQGIDSPLSNALDIFPNPATNTFHFETEVYAGEAQWQLTDMQGRRIRAGMIEKNGPVKVSVEMTGIAKGMYFLKVKDGESVRVGRVLKE